MKFAVIGAGSWGTTIANLLTLNSHDVTLWAREPEVVEGINKDRKNPFFVSDLPLEPNLKCTNDVEEALNNADYALFAIPSTFLASSIKPLKHLLKKVKGVANVAKGFEQGTGRSLSEVICEVLDIEPESPEDRVACLSGPNIATEVAQKRIGASVIACPDEQTAKILQKAFATDYFRIYRQLDRKGVELGGTLKNIFAIGAGILDGMELGDNAKAAYLTRSLHEMVRLGTALGGQVETFYGLAGLGDLITTANSYHSRNHKLGMALAKGVTLKEHLQTTRMVVEGVEATRIASEWGKKLNIQIPITEELSKILFSDHSAENSPQNLMARSL